MKIKELEKLASEMVGDGKSPHLFFVSAFEGGRKSSGVILITRNFELAHAVWRNLPRTHESTLEGRKYGTICSVEPKEEGSKKLIVVDNSADFRKYHSKA